MYIRFLIFFLALLSTESLYAQRRCDGVLCPDGSSSYWIESKGGSIITCSPSRDYPLYIGDVVRHRSLVNKDHIILHHSGVEIEGNGGRVEVRSVNAPGLLKKIGNFISTGARKIIGVFSGKKIRRWYAVSRGYGGAPPTPGRYATLISRFPVEFGGFPDGAVALVMEDHAGKIVYRHTITYDSTTRSATPFAVTPEKMKLKKGETYLWYYADSLRRPLQSRNILRYLDMKTDKLIRSGIKSPEDSDSTRWYLQTALYFQGVSDIAPETVDLYWASYQLLLKASSVTGSDSIMYWNIQNRYWEYLGIEEIDGPESDN
jgi:hypothetical protein